MSLNKLEQLLKILIKVFNYCQAHRIVNLVKMGMMLMIFYMLFMEFYMKSREHKQTQNENIILKKMGDMLKGCGENVFSTWVVVEGNKLAINDRKFSFVEVVGCVGNIREHCPVSVKMGNDIYLNTYRLSYDDISHLNKLNSGQLISCSVIDNEAICPDYTPFILNTILKSTKYQFTKINYIVVKNFKSDPVWIFSLGFTTSSIPTCSEQVGNSLLENLARTAKENLDL